MRLSASPRTAAGTLYAPCALLTAPVHAATGSADSAQGPMPALAIAAQSTEEEEVRLHSGTFSITSNIDLLINGALSLRGGWSVNRVLQSNDPGSSGEANTGQISGTLQSAHGEHEVTLYRSSVCNHSGHGEGRTFIGAISVIIGTGGASTDGSASFSADVADPNVSAGGNPITAMPARRGGPDGGNTSEYSAGIVHLATDILTDGFKR